MYNSQEGFPRTSGDPVVKPLCLNAGGMDAVQAGKLNPACPLAWLKEKKERNKREKKVFLTGVQNNLLLTMQVLHS